MQAEVTMLRDLARLRAPLPEGEARGLEAVDPRLVAITTLAEKGQHDELASEVEKLFDEGVFDIRPISFYLWVAFSDRGLVALPEAFETIAILVSSNLSSLGPLHKREDHVARRIGWFMQKVTDAITYHEARNTPEWQRWREDATPALFASALDAAAILDRALPESLAAVRKPFQQLTARLRALALSLAAPKPASMVPSRNGAYDAPPATVASIASIPSIAAPPMSLDASRAELRPGRIELQVSHEFFILLQKLDAFAKLTKKGDFARAAIVGDDVTHLIEHFDPRAYFPEVFSEFSALVATHIAKLGGEWQDKDSLAWKARAQFYRVDLRRFSDGS